MTWGEVTEDGQRSAVLRKSLLDVNSHRKMPVGLLVTPGQQEGAGAGWGSLSEGFLVDTARARSSHPSPVPSQLCPCRLRPPQTPRETENRERKGMGAGMNGEGWGRMESGLFSPLFPQLSRSREGNEDERAALAARRGGQTRSCCRDDPGSAPGPASAGREGSVGTDTPRFLRARPGSSVAARAWPGMGVGIPQQTLTRPFLLLCCSLVWGTGSGLTVRGRWGSLSSPLGAA